MYKSILFVSIVLLAVAASLSVNDDVLDDNLIREVNSNPHSSWKAGRNPRFEGVSIGQAMSMMGTRKSVGKTSIKEKASSSIPSSFDSRVQWPNCIHPVLNQEQCGSCWAFSTSEALSDRLCIASNGQINVTLSPQALVSCDTYGNEGCNGGVPQLAWEYCELHGLPTYSCYPYTSGNGTDGDCIKDSCADNSQYQLFKAKEFTMKTCDSVECIQELIYANGPIVGTMEVYQDFISYTSGVYVYNGTAPLLGGHAIKIVGWGTDSASGLDYWAVQNSWGPTWGLNGFFWIQRGVDMCGIDHDASASQGNTKQ
ncbi:hypothetical protein DLAC_09777 [Tieghemostelium lacteum]|uniref:Peptidase C1A papain C-terminal domain-containing protein n=1 Tax=Tieghemostelium lacteum TaxID=361077 RepID=A0A151Z7A1_TIELA|nr:hypothetical protein DLAC_09777 [Tieghemostelium lacteum]|eukprot:KYQ89807.1 hypothetical protein DLAC_09777 [Tieghemostelium lacteum]